MASSTRLTMNATIAIGVRRPPPSSSSSMTELAETPLRVGALGRDGAA
jgi:hypothetical protein